MICLLTSSIVIPGTEELNPANGFVDALTRHFPQDCRAVFVCSDPDGGERTDFFAHAVRATFERAGFQFRQYLVLDGRNARDAAALVGGANLLILGGGHVPTQNRYFQNIGLRELVKAFAGVVVGISAGSMNSAGIVYAHPELDGEAINPAYQRFLPGLGLTDTMLIPHYQEVKDETLDGQRAIGDIACGDSRGRTFYAVPDGSYLFIGDGREELRGEAYAIRDGAVTKVAGEGDVTFMHGCTGVSQT